ncbi:hypothetical protein [Nostoc linckia]|uniref:hypothetical protein n=1 Tax=Nostoc linckia TaxID=92942 RepID=UPI0015D48CAE|nr:hypothetical protein [Nostoc linckia]
MGRWGDGEMGEMGRWGSVGSVGSVGGKISSSSSHTSHPSHTSCLPIAQCPIRYNISPYWVKNNSTIKVNRVWEVTFCKKRDSGNREH